MVDRFKAGKDLYETVRELIGAYHPDLAMCAHEFAILFRETAKKSKGYEVPFSVKKASSDISLLGEKDYKFIIEIAADIWMELPDRDRRALLDKALMSCQVEYDEKKQEYKFKVRSAPLSFYPEELERYGVWYIPRSDSEQEAEKLAKAAKSIESNLPADTEDAGETVEVRPGGLEGSDVEDKGTLEDAERKVLPFTQGS